MRSQRHRRAKTSVVGALLLLIVSGLISPALARPREAPVKADWIVTLEPGARAADHGREAARAAGGSMGRLYQHALNGFEFRGTAAAAAALLRNPLVRTVVRDGSLHAIAESIPPGIRRIDAHHPSQPDAHEAGFTGAGVRVAILDTGVDLTHPDLIGNLDADLGLNCMTAGPPQDGHGHGTHVAGITAAVTGNDVGVAGVAPDARIVPIKVLDDTGYGEWSNLICAIDYLTGLMLDTDPDNDVLVANMSLGDVGSIGDCLDGGVREAICTSVEAGITYVAAAGNSTVNVSTFIPAAYPEVIAVSAITDLDGEPGGLGGCWLWIVYCDDTLAEFSNYGLGIDVAGPGTNIYSSWVGGGYRSESGTSMAAPHVAGVAALVKAARPAMTPTDIEDLLKATGECANGAFADADGSDSCAGKGTRGNDPDGYGEPLVNALHAAQAATTWSARPTVTITEPSHGDLVSGAVLVVADADDDEGVASVEFLVNGRLASTDTDGSDGWSFVWDSDAAFAGAYSLTARAVDVGGRAATDSVDVSTGSNVQGDWVGRYGQAGYALFAWTSTSDLVLLPTATMTIERGARSSIGDTTDPRGLQSPDGLGRRGGAIYDATQVRVRLDFSTAYTGYLHIYAVDWTTVDRRERITVTDGTGGQAVELTSVFQEGAWMHFPISVVAGGRVTITADKLAGANVLFHGLFLGEGAPPPPSAPGAPTLVSANPADGQVALSWIAPSSDGGSSITSYTATATPEGATCVTTGATACTITGLANGTAYSFSVVAANAAGLGPASNALEATPRTVPGAPQGIVASPGNTVVGLSWEAPSSDGGAPVTGYKVYRGTSPGTGTLRATLGTVLSYSDTSLTNGTTYYYTIRALNPAGEGPSSAETPAKPFGPPGAPRSPVAVGRPGSVAIGWTAPLSDGGASVSGYRIQRGEAPGAGTEIATVGNVLSYTDATAVDGTTYYYTVSAVNAGGEGARSIAVAGTPPEIPGVEGDWLGRYGSAGYAMFAWTSSADLVLLPTATLTIERGARSAGGVTAETRALRSPDGSSRRIGAIYDKTRVRFRLDFTSAYSGFLHIYAVDWATIDRRERITVMNGASGQATELLTAFPQGAWLHYPITVAAGGRVTITADKLAGANVLLNGVFLGDGAAPPQTAPSAPRNLAAAAASPKGVNLTWTAPITNSGSLIIGYQIYRSTASGAGVLLTTVGDVLTYRDAATQKNVRYYYKVVAVNAIGASAFSNEATAVAR